MSNYHIGISGLQIAQRAIDLVGTNIANAATEGYHRQELRMAPLVTAGSGTAVGGGAEVAEVRRNLDTLLEREVFRHRPQAGDLAQQLQTLESIEAALGDVDSEGLGKSLETFFNSLRELSAQPTSRALREQAVWAADALGGQFRSLSGMLDSLDENLLAQARQLVEKINGLAEEAADMNREIQAAEARSGLPLGSSGAANLLRDRRDQIFLELAELADAQVEDHGSVLGALNLSAWGTPLVLGDRSSPLEVELTAGGQLGVSVKGSGFFATDVRGGRLGALVTLRNEVVPDLRNRLDTLARALVTHLNRLHLQGVGTAGGFAELAGWSMSDGALSDWDAGLTAGEFHIRVTDVASGQVTRHAVSLDPAIDTLADVAARLDALEHLSASVVGGALHIQAESGYRFDFLPALDSAPYTSNLTGTAQPVIAGSYQGQDNQVYTCTVSGSGQVGLAENLSLEVRNGAGELVTTLNVGLGYAAGDMLEAGDGIRLALGPGSLNDGEDFTIQALAESDPTGFLAAAGMNALFEGTSAGSLAVCPQLLDDSDLLATARNPGGTDNENVRRMAEVAEAKLAELGQTTPGEYHRRFVTGVGQSVANLRARQSGLDNILRQLQAQRERVSGVDINEEAARLLVFERMFQAVSQFIRVQDRSLGYLMELV